jgi:hypothetical protein
MRAPALAALLGLALLACATHGAPMPAQGEEAKVEVSVCRLAAVG